MSAASTTDPLARAQASQIPDDTRKVDKQRPLVLLIEDDFTLRGSLAECLDVEGFDVESAANGLEGLRRLLSDQRRPSVILLDMVMPYMSGLEFCEQRNAMPGLASIPVISITGSGLSKQQLRTLGIHQSFAKPLSVAKLVQTLRELLAVRPPPA